MESSEPALVPEWLRCSGNATAAASTPHYFASSSDFQSSTLSARNKALRSINDKDSLHSSFLDRSSSSHSRRSLSSNGSSKHPYSSFTRSHRDTNRDREKQKAAFRDLWDSDPLTSILGTRIENTLRLSQSMVSRQPGEVLPRRQTELNDGGCAKHSSEIRMVSSGSAMRGMQNVPFEKDFPSLRVEEKQAVDVVRLPSPFGTAAQILPMGNSGLIGGEGWTSALVEVPAIIANNITGTALTQHNIFVCPASKVSSSVGGFNMAETLSEAPSRAHLSPQLPDKIQRLEELAIKQSKQLIPMRPSTGPKPLQSRKSIKTNETIVAAKIRQQKAFQSPSASQSLHCEHIKSGTPKTSHGGKFLVLKPLWENGVASTTKDCSSVAIVEDSIVPVATAATASPLSSLNFPHHATIVRKTAALNLKSIAEKRASFAQTQSRSDFFNLMRKKNTLNSSIITPDPGPILKDLGVIEEIGNTPESPYVITENGNKVASNCGILEGNGFSGGVEKSSSLNEAVYPDEEEAAFLRSLGWEENDGEDEGLTEEEINTFYQEYMKLMPSLKVRRGILPKTAMVSESYGSK